jgi:hypothetical protein
VEKPIFSKASYHDDLVLFRETAISGVCTIGPQNGSNPFRAGGLQQRSDKYRSQQFAL